MDPVRVSLPDQENISERRTRKSSKYAIEQPDRRILRTLQPHGSLSTGNRGTSSCKSTAEMPPFKNLPTRTTKKSSTTASNYHLRAQKNKGVQTKTSTSRDYEMCTSEEPPLEYWKVLAEQRRQALAETLEENEELHRENEELRKKITELEKRVENKDYFAMMYQIACSDSAKDQ